MNSRELFSQDVERSALDTLLTIRRHEVGIATHEEMHTMGAQCPEIVHTSDAQEPLQRRTALVVVRSLPVISSACA